MKKTFYGFLLLIFSTGALAATFSASSPSGNPGQTINVQLSWTGDTVQSMQYTLSYDPNILTNPDLSNCVQFAPGNLPAACVFVNNDGVDPDIIGITTGDTTNPLPTANPFGTISFTIDNGASPGTTPLDLANTNCTGGTCNASDGTVTIQGTASGTITNPVNFGDVPVSSTSGDQTITVTSTGSSDLTITNVVESDPSNVFGVTDNCTGSGPHSNGETCTIDVNCTPTSTTSFSGSITVNTNAGPLVSNLSCDGIAPGPQLTPQPELTMGGDIGSTANNDATLTNTGALAVTIDQINILNDTNGDFSVIGGTGDDCTTGGGTTLNENDDCQIRVECDIPSAEVTATLQVTFTNNPARGAPAPNPVTTGLRCTPNLPDPELTPDPLTLTGPIGGTDSDNLTLANNGSGPLTNISIPGSVGIFSVIGGDCPSDLPAGNNCSITIECTIPASSDTENFTVTFDAFGNPATSSVSTQLICQPQLPDPQLTPNPLTLSAPVGDTDSGDLTLANNGSGPLTNISIPGGVGVFSETGHNCPTDLPAGNSCTIPIECTAQSNSETETFTVSFDPFNNTSSVSTQLICDPLLPIPELDPQPELILSGNVGEEVTERTTLSNTGGAPLEGISIPSTSSNGLFDIANVDCPVDPQSLAAGDSCSIDGTCTVEAEVQTDTLVVDFSNANSVTLALVCNEAIPIPTLSPWGLAVLAGLLGLFGIRRRVAM